MKKSPGRKAKRANERAEAKRIKAEIRKFKEQQKAHQAKYEQSEEFKKQFHDFARPIVDRELKRRYGDKHDTSA